MFKKILALSVLTLLVGCSGEDEVPVSTVDVVRVGSDCALKFAGRANCKSVFKDGAGKIYEVPEQRSDWKASKKHAIVIYNTGAVKLLEK